MGTLEITTVMNHDKVTNNGIRLEGLEKDHWGANKEKVTRKDQTSSRTIVNNTTKQDPRGGGGGWGWTIHSQNTCRIIDRLKDKKLEKENMTRC